MEQKNQNIDSMERKEMVKHHSFRVRAYASMRKILIGFILISIANAIFSQLFYTPKIHNINRKNSELSIKYSLLNNRILATESRINEIAHRDNYVYRSLFGVDTISLDELNIEYPESKYSHLDDNPFSPIMLDSWKKIDRLAQKMYGSSRSFDELQTLAQNKESMSNALPAIWPIDRTKLISICHFGMRLHPIYKRRIMHKGIDLGCDKGTPIFATGDGVVTRSMQGLKYSGYGQELTIDHGYGYKTRYGHLSKRLVQKGDSVKRGQIIGEVGSSGGSTGPHLHYEVIVRGNVVNPIYYFDRNMSNEEYTRLMEEMKSTEYELIDSLEYGNKE